MIAVNTVNVAAEWVALPFSPARVPISRPFFFIVDPFTESDNTVLISFFEQIQIIDFYLRRHSIPNTRKCLRVPMMGHYV